jgi:hypothetical protein
MWWFKAFDDNFASPVADARVQVFRLVLGLACTMKFGESIRHGGWGRFGPGTFERFRVERRLHTAAAALVTRGYRGLLVLRLAAAVLLTVGIGTRPALTVIIVALVVEQIYEFRSHALFLLACCACLLTAGEPGSGLQFSGAHSAANTWSQCLLVLLMVNVYLATALSKIRSEQFRSGAVLAQYIFYMNTVRYRLPYPEVWYPKTFVRLLGGNDVASLRRCRALSVLTIVLELMMPFGLLIPETYPFAVVVGLAMHAGFTVILPRLLTPFTVAALGTFVLFHP